MHDTRWMVDVIREGDRVVVTMAAEEAERMSFALRAGTEGTSRAEYWIRHGVTKASVSEVARCIREVAQGTRDSASAGLESGVETEENPRRPRP